MTEVMHDDVEASGWEPGDLQADPCDRMVELELPPGGRLTFLSDLHFTERGPLADFQAGDALHQLLRSVHGHAGPVILVLGGDVLDLLQLSGPRDKAVSRALRGEDARRLGEELHRLAERPDATIVYLVGNHDASLAWDGRGRRRVAHQLAADHVGLHLRVRLHGPEGGQVILVAEHGDALDLYNRRSDPFDPLDSPAGDHIVTELVRRMDTATERRPELALDQVNNIRPTAMVPTWMVANFFYRYLSRALQDIALPLTGLFLLLHLPIVATLAAGLLGRLGPVGELSGRLAGWAVLVAALDLVLVGVIFAFVGRTLRQAVSVYGGSPEELESCTATPTRLRSAGSTPSGCRSTPAAGSARWCRCAPGSACRRCSCRRIPAPGSRSTPPARASRCASGSAPWRCRGGSSWSSAAGPRQAAGRGRPATPGGGQRNARLRGDQPGRSAGRRLTPGRPAGSGPVPLPSPFPAPGGRP
jgi:UDP-2,3-diacylglucosamine pyrophosphatase LpxH